MKKTLSIIFLIFSGCTMYIPPNTGARSVVTRYLDSVNKLDNIPLLSFIKIEKKDIDNGELIKEIEDAKSDSVKSVYKKLLDSANVDVFPNGFYCKYQIGKLNHVAAVRLDSTFSRVVQFTEFSR